jgi:hypothetical protein
MDEFKLLDARTATLNQDDQYDREQNASGDADDDYTVHDISPFL